MPGRFNRCKWTVIAASVALSACRSPLESGKTSATLQKTLAQAIARELDSLDQIDGQGGAQTRATTRPEGDAAAELVQRRDELEAIGPLSPNTDLTPEMGLDLSGRPQGTVTISLEDA